MILYVGGVLNTDSQLGPNSLSKCAVCLQFLKEFSAQLQQYQLLLLIFLSKHSNIQFCTQDKNGADHSP